MSQIPPQPPYPPQNPQQPGYPPQQPGYPPQQGYPQQPGYPPQQPGYPPQPGGYPPGGGYGQPPPGNAWGVTSLISGILGFCTFGIGGILAVLFGFVGVAKARKVRRGMGLSIAGILLGLLSIGVWAMGGGAAWRFWKGTELNRDVAKQFITDLHAGNTTAAQAKTTRSVTTAELDAWSRQLKALGTIQDITTIPVPIGANADAGTGKQTLVTGVITFPGSKQEQFQMMQVLEGDQWKVDQFAVGVGNSIAGPRKGPRGSGSATAPSGAEDSSDEK